MASLPRRRLLLGAGALALAGCERRTRTLEAARTPALDMDRLNREIGDIARSVRPGVLGVGLMNLDSEEAFTFNGDRAFPMQSVFKAPLAAAVLAEIDAGRLSHQTPFRLEEMDLSPWSAIARAWPVRRDYTARELLNAAVVDSDNTAADVLMARIGGPGAVTAWLNDQHVEAVGIDRYERELQPEILGLPPFRPEWRNEAAFAAAWRAVPAAEQLRAVRAYLADRRDTATPRGMLDFLSGLDSGAMVSPASRQLLLQMMAGATTGAGRLKAGLPRGALLAHKSGVGPRVQGVLSAINDVGIAILPDGRRYAMAVFLMGSTLVEDASGDAPIAAVARALIRGAR